MPGSNTSFNNDTSIQANVSSNQEDISLGKALRQYSFYWFLSAINLAIPLMYIPICHILWGDKYLTWLSLGIGIVLLNIVIIIIAIFLSKDNKEQETTSSTIDSMPIGSDNLQQASPDETIISAKDFAKYVSIFTAMVTAILSLCALPAAYFIIEIETEYFVTYLVIDLIIMAFFLIMCPYKVFTDYRKFRGLSA